MKNKEAHEQFRNYLKGGKHRVTPERFDVLDAAIEFKGHFGADDLYVQMKSDKMNISRATIYNTLELLADCGLLAKRHFGDNKTHYESSFKRKNHDHLVCPSCGQINEFYNEKIQEIVKDACEELGYQYDGHSFTIFGKCKDQSNCKHSGH